MTIWQFLDSPDGRRDPWMFLFIVIIVAGIYSIAYVAVILAKELIRAVKSKIINDYLESNICEGDGE